MNLTHLIRNQFTVALCTANSLVEKSLKTYLGLNGYNLNLYNSESDLVKKDSHSSAFHIIVIDLKIVTKLSGFLEQMLKINPETLFIGIGPASLAHKIEKYYTHGLRGLVSPEAGLESQMMMILDNLVTELYYRYQNEQLLITLHSKEKELADELEANVKKLEIINQTLGQKIENFEREHRNLDFELKKQKEIAEQMVWLNRTDHETFERAMSNEQKDPIASFLIHLEQIMDPHPIKGFYFRYMPQVESFILTQHSNISSMHQLDLRTLRYRPAELTALSVMEKLEKSEIPEELSEFIEVSIGVQNLIALPLSYLQHREGFFLFDPTDLAVNPVILRKIKSEFKFFKSLYFQRKLTQLWKIETKGIDKTTQLETKDLYYEKLSSEFARAQRLNHPMSLIKIAIDHRTQISEIYPESVMQSLLAQVARLIKVSSRINDLAFKTADNEFSLILPHTSAKGAAVRAERLRRMVEGHVFNNYHPGYVTISSGIAEYPTLAVTVDSLEEAAHRALNFIQKRANNRVCLFTLESSR